MPELNLDILENLGYYSYMGVKYDEKYTFFYDETNNCRKFWIREEDNSFNTDYDADFVLAGVCFDREVPDIKLADLIDVLKLQKNINEVKFNRHFSNGDFLSCVGDKRTLEFLKWIASQQLYIHYFNVNNLYYAIVEILDSIADPQELDELGFNYFDMKAVLFKTLKLNPEKLQLIMSEYKFPNISKDKIPDFCDDVISLFPSIYDCSPEQKHLMACLKRAKERGELIFLEGNKDYIMQDNYMEFYIDNIRTYGNSYHYYDEELSIQKILEGYSLKRNGEVVSNYSFVNSENMVWIQVSDVVAGILGKMFKYVNQNKTQDLIRGIAEYSDNQLESIYLLHKLRFEADIKDKGLLHSITSIDIIARIYDYLTAVCYAFEKK